MCFAEGRGSTTGRMRKYMNRVVEYRTGGYEVKEEKFFDTFFLMGLPELERVAEWLELVCAETKAQEEFLNRVEAALEVIDYDYYIATMEPTIQNGGISYSKEAPVATGLTGRQWMKKATTYFTSSSWRSNLAMLEEGDLFKAYRVAIGYWSLEEICDNSSRLGNYWMREKRNGLLPAGKTESGGFPDGVGNTFEIYRDKGGIALVGGCYLSMGDMRPVTQALRFYPDAVSQHGRGVLVIKQD